MKELKEIKKLFKLMIQENLYELNVEEENFKITIKRKTNSSCVSEVAKEIPKEQTLIQESANITPVNCIEIASPIHGVFYRGPSPDVAPFVDIDSVVEKGGTVCIVEAMKLMNEIQVEESCKIIKVMVENTASVTAGQVLFLAEQV